jgi:hypothetical protein
MTEHAAPGWDAIDAALQRRYPGVKPLHHGPALKYVAGGQDPLDGISCYPRDDHWHLVSYGMSELYTKESDDPDYSGWGFEFTIRVARAAGDDEPPTWAMSLLQNLARHVFSVENPFVSGSHIKMNGPISVARPDTEIRAVVFAEDPELGTVATPHGEVQFLQVVGLTLAEYAVIDRWGARRLLDTLRQWLPLLITDLDRADLTADPAVAAAIEDGVRRDGSSTAAVRANRAAWHTTDAVTTVTLDAAAAERIGLLLPLRIPYGRYLEVNPFHQGVRFMPGDEFTTGAGPAGTLQLRLPAAAVAELAAVLQPVPGTHAMSHAPGLHIDIVR